jgi:hypothetical protein
MEHYLRGAGGEVVGVHRYADTLCSANVQGLGMLAAAVPDAHKAEYSTIFPPPLAQVDLS